MQISMGNRARETAVTNQSIAVTLANELGVSQGDVSASHDAPPYLADEFDATMDWMNERPPSQGQSYIMKFGPQTVTATVYLLKCRYRVNVNKLRLVAAQTLEANDVWTCSIKVSPPIVLEEYSENRGFDFVLLDRTTNVTVGTGLIHFALRRSANVHWQVLDVNKATRAKLKGQAPCVVWFTGLSAAGKTTIANLVEKRLHALGRHTYLLDGDNVRHGLNKDLDFTNADRVENIRRIAEVARLMVDAGLIVLVAFISPFRAERRMARELVVAGEFVEVFIDTPLAVAEERDPKGLYKKARRGELKNFTGIDSPYERPERPEVLVDTTRFTSEQAADLILRELEGRVR
jgi:bifunctional enzyme CysN/CysC